MKVKQVTTKIKGNLMTVFFIFRSSNIEVVQKVVKNSHLAISLDFVPSGSFSSTVMSCVLFVFFSFGFEATKFLIISGLPDFVPVRCLGSGSSMSICFGLACECTPSTCPVAFCDARLRFLQNLQATQPTNKARNTSTEATITIIMVVRSMTPEEES